MPQFVDWPISYEDLNDCYGRAEWELGVSADLEEQKFLGINFPAGYKYPMPKIPRSLVDVEVGDALKSLSEDNTRFLEMEKPPTSIRVRSLPAAILNRTRIVARAPVTRTVFRSVRSRRNTIPPLR